MKPAKEPGATPDNPSPASRRLPVLAAALASLLVASGAVGLAGLVRAHGPAAPAPAPTPAPAATATAPRETLRPLATFASIADERARSLALFEEAGRVITHARCVNCHPVDDRPRQGDDRRLHQPPVVGAAGGMGPPGMACVTCHGPANAPLAGVSLASMPGHPKWHLAPPEMAWENKSLGEICRQIKDPARNGGKDMAALHHHMAHDDLVGWGWDPGAGREPAPGTQAAFGEIIKAWIDTGAHCP